MWVMEADPRLSYLPCINISSDHFETDSLEDEKLTTAGNLEKSTNNNMASSNNSGFYSGGLGK